MNQTKEQWTWIDGGKPCHQELVLKDYEGEDSVLYHGANWRIDKNSAALIEVAPQLLAACEEASRVLGAIKPEMLNETCPGVLTADQADIIDTLEQVIAKARA